MVAILGYSREQILDAVQSMYAAVADTPGAGFHFPVGEPAGRALGYPAERLKRLPARVRESFVGVGDPFHAEAMRPGDTVLDIGAGAGGDTLIAAGLAGPEGHVVALDLTEAMTRKLKHAIDEAGTDNVSVLRASAEGLPLADESVDVITSNGVLNLVPDKRRAVAEMFRVLRPGGRVQIADVVIRRPVTVDCREDPRLWVECVVGATVDEDFLALFREAGFEDVRVLRGHDYFAHSPSRQTREIAAGFGARSIEATMRRGPRAPGRFQRWLYRLNPVRGLARLRRHGLMGAAGLVTALLACYGTLSVLALLTALGAGHLLNNIAWAGPTSAGAAAFAAVAVAAGIRRHRRFAPAVLAVAGAGLVGYALLIHFNAITELVGFVLLGAAVVWDIRLRRRAEARVLGLRPESGHD
jgi:SAM-dependent methyltransferase